MLQENNTGNVLSGTSSVDGPVEVTTFTVAGMTDEQGDLLVFNAGETATIADVGELTLAVDGAYTFVPDGDYNGDVPVVTYTVTDGSGTDDTSTLSISVTPRNDDFTDENEEVIVAEDSIASGENNTGNVLSGTSSVDGPVEVTTFTVAGMTDEQGDLLVFNAGETATIADVRCLYAQR